MIDLSKNLKEIREYTNENIDLQKSHHFLFNLPITNHKKISVIIIGENPGESINDYTFNGSTPTEESNEFNFQEKLQSKSSIKFHEKCKNLTSNSEGIVLSEFFFWSSPQSGEDKKRGVKFSERFGQTFKKSQHFGFCKKHNIDLINYYSPTLILAPGLTNSDFFSSFYGMKHIETINSLEKNNRLIERYEFLGIPFLFVKHFTGARISNIEKNQMIDYIKKVLKPPISIFD